MKSRPDQIKKIIHKSHHLNELIQVSRQQQQILETIKKLIDPKLAPHCIAAHYSKQCLKLFTDSSVWASRLRFQSKSLVRQLQANQLPTHKIDVRVIPKSQINHAVMKKRTARKVSAQAADNIIQTAKSIEDEELQAALERLAKSAIKPTG